MAALAVMIRDVKQDLINGRAIGPWPGIAGFRQGSLLVQLPFVLYRHQHHITIPDPIAFLGSLELVMGMATQYPRKNLCKVPIYVLGVDEAHGQIRRQVVQKRLNRRRPSQ